MPKWDSPEFEDVAAPPSRVRHGARRARVAGWIAGVALAGLLLLPGSGTASAGRGSVDALLTALIHDGAPGAVAFVRDGNRVRTFTAGFADLRRREPMRVTLRFRMGSLSKPVVATLVLKLVAQRRLRLSDTVAHWLPGLIPGGSKITLRKLLEHRSGLHDYIDSPELFPTYFNRKRPLDYRWAPARLLRLATQDPLDFAPGTRWEYSNTNYIVLGLILERVTHIPLQRYAEQSIFEPLHMSSTSFAFGAVPGAHAHGYAPFGAPFPPAPGGLGDVEPLIGSWAWAAGALVSTAPDLDRFFRALFAGRIIPARLVRLMQDALPASPRFRYGLGLLEWPFRCGAAWGHTGDVPGYTTAVLASRDANKLFVLLINRDFFPATLAAESDKLGARLYCGRSSAG